MKDAKELRIVYCNTDTYQNASLIAKNIIAEQLAACVSIIPNVVSIFSWENAIQERHEFTLMIKTTASALTPLEKRILELHTDEVPEIIAIEAQKALLEYYEWVQLSVVQ